MFPEFLKRGLLKFNAQFTRLAQVFRDIIAKDSESALHSCAGGDRSARTAPKVGVVKLGVKLKRWKDEAEKTSGIISLSHSCSPLCFHIQLGDFKTEIPQIMALCKP